MYIIVIYFPVCDVIKFELTLHEKCPSTEFFCSVFSCIQSECRKIQTRKNSIFGHISHNISFFIKPFSYMIKQFPKKSEKKLKNFKIKRAFKVAFFMFFKGLSVTRNCPRLERMTLIGYYIRVWIQVLRFFNTFYIL